MCIDEIKDTSRYEFFNILWIERGEGDVVIHRKALGYGKQHGSERVLKR